MPIAGILRSIETERDAAIDAAMAAGRAEAERIRDDAGRRADIQRGSRSKRRDAETDLERARIVNGARLAAERRMRAARETLYQQAHQLMRERLQDVRSQPEYPQLMQRLISEAQAVLPDADAILVDPRDLDVTRDVAENMGIPVRVSATIESMGGAELVGHDGRRVSNTLDARAEKAAAPLRRLAVDLIPALGSRR